MSIYEDSATYSDEDSKLRRESFEDIEMARDQVVRLFREAQANPSLRERFNLSSSPEEFVQLAQQHGYHFTVEEWRESMRFSVEELNCKLSEIPGI